MFFTNNNIYLFVDNFKSKIFLAISLFLFAICGAYSNIINQFSEEHIPSVQKLSAKQFSPMKGFFY